jgi:hypothetical protein
VRSFLYSAVSLCLLAAACGGDSSGPQRAGPPAALTVVSGGTQEGAAGEALGAPLTVKVVDRDGLAVANTVVMFSVQPGNGSLSAARDTTDAAGLATTVWTLGTTVGASRAEARVQGLAAPAVFNATVRAGAPTGLQRVSNPPGSSAAGFELADSVVIKLADQFGNAVAGTSVTFAIVNGGGSVNPATVTTNAEGIARTNWTLGSAGAQSMRVSAGALQTVVDATAAACSQTTVPIGGVLTLGPSDPRCVVLGGTAQRYFVTVVNTAPTAGNTNAFRVRGAGAGTGMTSGDVANARAVAASGLSAAARAMVDEAREHSEVHDQLLRANERVMEQMLRVSSNRSAITMRSQAVPVAPPNVGDTLNMRIPGNFSNLCSLSGAATIRARVVFVGQHGVMLEDVAAPVAGQIDTLYQRVGQEFDNTMWSILTTNFGSPLAMDPQTDNNERFYMLFSKFVNDMQGGGIAGFVSSSDFFSPSLCPSSNLAEVFYARVPINTNTGFGSGTPGDWYRRTRTVMIHEVKHIVSFAERIKARMDANTPIPPGFNDADRWLEESSAMLAEELWARTQYGYQAKANVNYASSVGCEVRPNGSTNPTYGNCGLNKPLAMFDHFILFYDYQSNVEGFTPIGAANSGDFTYYGSGWSFLRWVLDTYGVSEAALLTALTREYNLPGVRNIEERTGRTFTDLINDWAIAVALDDYPNFTPLAARHQLVSWNSRDIFAGMSTDFSNQGFFTRPAPLQVRPASFGKFAIDVSSVRGGSMAVFEVTGAQSNQQMFEFNGLAGATFPADMRVNIIRVQ